MVLKIVSILKIAYPEYLKSYFSNFFFNYLLTYEETNVSDTVQVFFLKWQNNYRESFYMNYVTISVSTELWNKAGRYGHI